MHFRYWRWHFWFSKISSPFCDVADCIFQFSKDGWCNVSNPTCAFRTFFATPHQEMESTLPLNLGGLVTHLRPMECGRNDALKLCLKRACGFCFLEYLPLNSRASMWAIQLPRGLKLMESPWRGLETTRESEAWLAPATVCVQLHETLSPAKSFANS